MKIIIGLGNPGKKYENTRHNAGFMVLDALVKDRLLNPANEQIVFNLDKKLTSRVVNTLHKGEKIILVKPDTFMNASGLSVANLIKYYKAELSDLIVIADDIDLPLGEARVRLTGGSAGQKGLQSIIDILGSDDFTRIRVGINDGSENNEHDKLVSELNTADYVLQKFSDRELPIIKKIIAEIVVYVVDHLGTKDEFKATTLKIGE